MADEGQNISPWIPETDPHRLAALGKLAEECNELGGRAARCIIQGLDELDPETGRTNRDELGREISDVLATILHVQDMDLAASSIKRTNAKLEGYRRWQTMIDPAIDAKVLASETVFPDGA